MLVTGGAGFIGSHVVDRLVSLGHRVAVIDDLSTGRRQNPNPSAVLHQTNVASQSVQEVFEREHPEVVFHLAARASVSASVREPAVDAETNVLGAIRVLEAAHLFGTRKVVYTSTGGALYGEPERLPCDERHPIRPLAPYGTSKYVGELYVELFHRLHNLDYTILRYGNVYGPRQNPYGEAGVIAIFGGLMLAGKQPIINGSGEQERDFVFVSDVVEANVLALEKGSGQAFNIGSGVGASVNRVFDLLRQATGYTGGPVHGPALPGEVFKIYLDSSLARRELGWRPQVSLEEGLRLTVDHLRREAQLQGAS
ncbi:MAG: NAD-dependent epimerase/dehydratase family protein [Chloroflexota bacterium]|nr:NAD-dependent epimerase/dehydratase family protein [Chloroflexota bacterium]